YVSHAYHLPALIRHCATIPLRHDRRTIHEVEVVLPGARVSPQDVGLAIAVEVADACDLPVQIGHRAQIPLACEYLRAVHRVEVVLAGRSIAPQDVGPEVGVEVTAQQVRRAQLWRSESVEGNPAVVAKADEQSLCLQLAVLLDVRRETGDVAARVILNAMNHDVGDDLIAYARRHGHVR